MKKIIYLCLALLLMGSCNTEQKKDLNEATDEMGRAITEMTNDMKEEWNDFEAEARDLSARLDTKIAELESELETAGDNVSENLKTEKKQLDEWRRNLSEKMEMTKEEAAKDWQAFKKETKDFFARLDSALKNNNESS